MRQAKELEPHDDLKEEILRRTLDSRRSRSGRYLTLEEVKARLAGTMKDRAEPAAWKKIRNTGPSTAPD